VFLDITHVPAEILQRKFRHVYTTCLNYGLDITRERIPITPAAHYFMGGIRTDLSGRTNLKALYAAGEVASTGVHGANRLASNSLLEALVFGRRAAAAMREESGIKVHQAQPRELHSLTSIGLLENIRDITWRYAGIVRHAEGLKTGLKLLSGVSEESNLLTVARLIHECALARKESRGGHYREDFPATAETSFHSYCRKGQQLSFK
jgi:L-aspartate oxidase